MDINKILYKDKNEEVLAHVCASKKVIREEENSIFVLLAILFSVPAAISFISVGINNVVSFLEVYVVLCLIFLLPSLPFFLLSPSNKFTDYYVTNLRFIACSKKKYKAVTFDEIYKVKTNTTIIKEKKDQYVLYDISFYGKLNDKSFRKLSFDNLEEKDQLMNLILSLKDFEY